VSGFYKGSGHILTANRNYSCTTQITENFGLFCRKNARLSKIVRSKNLENHTIRNRMTKSSAIYSQSLLYIFIT